MKRRELRAHAHPELRVEVRERLIHEKCLRLTHDRAAHRDPLTLAARQRRGPSVEQVVQTEELSDLLDTSRDLRLRRPANLEPVAEVLAYRHVRVESVVLKDHRDVTRPRRQVGDVAGVDQDRPLGDVLEPGDHSQQGGFAAPRRADEDKELARVDLERHVVDGEHVAGKRLREAIEHDLCHEVDLYLTESDSAMALTTFGPLGIVARR